MIVSFIVSSCFKSCASACAAWFKDQFQLCACKFLQAGKKGQHSLVVPMFQ